MKYPFLLETDNIANCNAQLFSNLLTCHILLDATRAEIRRQFIGNIINILANILNSNGIQFVINFTVLQILANYHLFRYVQRIFG